MVDTLTPKQRSFCMSRVKGKDTSLEKIVRTELHKRGYRYRKNVSSLPGKPDLVFPTYSAVIFLHGCFWHGHNCHLYKLPKTRTEFWKNKISGNKLRDKRSIKELKKQGWYVATVWECALKGKTALPFDTVIEQTGKWLKYGKSDLVIRGKKR